MNKIKICSLILLGIMLLSCNKSDRQILEKTVSKLCSFDQVEIDEVLYWIPYNRIDTAKCFFDFTSPDTIIGAKYHFVSKNGEQVFNGKQEFNCDYTEKRILYTNEPSILRVGSSIYIFHSIFTLRKLLPVFLSDSNVTFKRKSDTLVNNIPCFAFDIQLTRKFINKGAVLNEFENNSNYLLLISQKDHLPVEFGTVIMKTRFDNYNTNTSREDLVWNMDRLPKDFVRLTYKELSALIKNNAELKVGNTAPDWILPEIGGSKVRLSNLYGKGILLEFWFQGCTPCIKSIPKINRFKEIYGLQGLQIYGIEYMQNDEEKLVDYIRKFNIKYPTLYSAKQIAVEYGIKAAPTFFLINEEKEILYISTGLKEDELIEAIEKTIK